MIRSCFLRGSFKVYHTSDTSILIVISSPLFFFCLVTWSWIKPISLDTFLMKCAPSTMSEMEWYKNQDCSLKVTMLFYHFTYLKQVWPAFPGIVTDVSPASSGSDSLSILVSMFGFGKQLETFSIMKQQHRMRRTKFNSFILFFLSKSVNT